MSSMSFSTTKRPGLVERTTTLALITVVAFVSNLVLLVTVCQSRSLRTTCFNRHIVNIALINLVTCILGLPMVIGYTVTETWDYGDIMCSIFSHFLLTVCIAMCLSILMMNVDRVVAIYNPNKYDSRITSLRTALLILAAWVVAILFPLPLSLGKQPVVEHKHRFICTIGAGASIDYLVSLYITCFAVPSVLNVLFFVYIAREASKDREAETLGVVRPPNFVRLWPEVQTAGVVLIIFVLWIVTELPFVTLTSVEQYINSDLRNGTEPFTEYSPDLETAFMWLKFCHNCLLPFVIFKWRQNIWFKFKDLIFCRKSNSILDSSPRQAKTGSATRSKPKPPQTPKPDTPKFEATFPIPTIKATKDGLHVHADEDMQTCRHADEDEEGYFYADMNITSKSFTPLEPAETQAVVELHHQPATIPGGEDGDQTSDYETDPYSQSDPISVRSAASNVNTSHIRSHSNTDSKDFRAKANSVSHDSGNGSASSSVKKKRRKKRAVANLSIEPECPVSNPEAGGVSPSPFAFTNSQISATLGGPNSHDTQPREDENNPYTIDLGDCTETSVPRKKKKKKKKQKNIIDAETNTTQVMSLEMMERRPLPPRLEPINPGTIQNSMTYAPTPPLRSKVAHSEAIDSLPPSGVLERRRHTPNDDEVTYKTEESSSSRKKKKSSSRPRHKSGDSNRPLMSSTASSELRVAVGEQRQETDL